MPYRVQHVLGRAAWLANVVRHDLRTYIVTHQGGAEGVLVIDETGFRQQGTPMKPTGA